MDLDARQNFVSAQYLQNELTEFNKKFCTCMGTRFSLGLLDVFFFSRNCNEVMALDAHQNFVSTQYVDNELTSTSTLTRSSLRLLPVFANL